jgi:hypothetical protein
MARPEGSMLPCRSSVGASGPGGQASVISSGAASGGARQALRAVRRRAEGQRQQVQLQRDALRHLPRDAFVMALDEGHGHDQLDRDDGHDQDQRGATIDAAGKETLQGHGGRLAMTDGNGKAGPEAALAPGCAACWRRTPRR